jgi:hypothetical protein
MKLPTQPSGPLRRDPKVLIIFGQTKVGKTTMLSKLPASKYLVIDTEKGSDFLTVNRHQVNNLSELKQVMDELTANISKYPYEYIVIDTIDNVIEWFEKWVLMKEGKDTLSEIPYGGGYSQIRERVMGVVGAFKDLDKKLILVGHRKKTSIENDAKDEFSISTLDISGKLKNFLCADADAIGYVYRDEESKLVITFKPTDFLEAGARPEHLRGMTFPFEWENIYVDSISSTPKAAVV